MHSFFFYIFNKILIILIHKLFSIILMVLIRNTQVETKLNIMLLKFIINSQIFDCEIVCHKGFLFSK